MRRRHRARDNGLGSRPGCARSRRGDQHAAVVTARSIGPLGLAGRQGSHRVPWQVRILPPFLSRKHLPSRLAKLRELDGMLPVLIRGQGTEFDSLREYVDRRRRPLDRLAGHARGGPTSWCAPGGPSATGGSSSCSTPVDLGGPRRRRPDRQ